MKLFPVGLLVAVTVIASTVDADNESRKDVSTDSKVCDELQLIPRHGWLLTFFRDGSVKAQYGSLPGDSASLPAETVDFAALVKATRRLTGDEIGEGASQVVFRYGDDSSATAVRIRDDTLFRYLVWSFMDDWRPHPIGDRFPELLQQHPIYKPQ